MDVYDRNSFKRQRLGSKGRKFASPVAVSEVVLSATRNSSKLEFSDSLNEPSILARRSPVRHSKAQSNFLGLMTQDDRDEDEIQSVDRK